MLPKFRTDAYINRILQVTCKFKDCRGFSKLLYSFTLLMYFFGSGNYGFTALCNLTKLYKNLTETAVII